MKIMSQLIGDSIDLIFRQILKHTPQLYYIENGYLDKTPKPLASCVLYANESNTNYYLITAKHVFNHSDEWGIGILIKNIFYSLEGNRFTIPSNDIDITVLKLTPELTNILLSEYNFLNSTQIDENHSYMLSTNRYLEVGFPITKSKLKKHDKTIRVEPFILLSDINKVSSEHVYINIPKLRRRFGDTIPIRIIPTLKGLSGSGLWYISSICRPTFKLVGIMIEWDYRDKKYTKGTKINLVKSLIEKIENNYNTR